MKTTKPKHDTIYNPTTPTVPEVHVSIQPVGDDVRDDAPGAAAHHQDGHRLQGLHAQARGQQERREGHQTKLAAQPHQHAPGPAQVSPQPGRLHGAAQGEHHHRQHGCQDDPQDRLEAIAGTADPPSEDLVQGSVHWGGGSVGGVGYSSGGGGGVVFVVLRHGPVVQSLD